MMHPEERLAHLEFSTQRKGDWRNGNRRTNELSEPGSRRAGPTPGTALPARPPRTSLPGRSSRADNPPENSPWLRGEHTNTSKGTTKPQDAKPAKTRDASPRAGRWRHSPSSSGPPSSATAPIGRVSPKFNLVSAALRPQQREHQVACPAQQRRRVRPSTD